MGAYPGSYVDQISLRLLVEEWERREQDHSRSPSDATDVARKVAAASVDKQRALIARRIKRNSYAGNVIPGATGAREE